MNASEKIIDLTPRFRSIRRQALAHTLLAVWTQYLSLAALALYGLLRLTVCAAIPVGHYHGGLILLWPAAYLLLLTSYVADLLLWREPGDE